VTTLILRVLGQGDEPITGAAKLVLVGQVEQVSRHDRLCHPGLPRVFGDALALVERDKQKRDPRVPTYLDELALLPFGRGGIAMFPLVSFSAATVSIDIAVALRCQCLSTLTS
jgi:hypothetical protein